MEFSVSRAVFADAFAAVARAVPPRPIHELHKNVRIDLESLGGASLYATDTEISLQATLPAEAVQRQRAGSVLVPASRMEQILRELRGDTLQLLQVKNQLTLACGSSEFRLTVADVGEFPAPPVPDADWPHHLMTAADLRRAIRQTIFATDVETSRYALGGVLVELGPETAVFASTDSRRLANVRTACRAIRDPQSPSPAPVVPARAMQLVERVLTEGDGDVRIEQQSNAIVFDSHNGLRLTSQLAQGRFPDYRKVIPSQFNATIDLVVGPFHGAIRQAAIITTEESRGVDFQFSRDTLRLSSQAADVGESRVELPIAGPAAPLTITFDPKYVADFLKVLDPGAAIQFQLIDHESAGVLSTTDGARYRYVVMPLSKDR